MKMRLLKLTFFLFLFKITQSQEIKSPSEFLGYNLGEKFTRHHQVVDYFKHLSISSELIKMIPYGLTNEERELNLVFLSSKDNLDNLELIRKTHLQNTGIIKGPKNNDNVVVWLSYNVHGNESSSTEASMKTVYEILNNKKDWLNDTIVIIDPCVNPDGRDRYVNFYKQSRSFPNDNKSFSKEHYEPWHNGRTNHYIFDLNRDWAWLTQIESQQRIKIYNKWLPHVHVDFHEQSINNPYYFAPAAEPLHEKITSFQKKFQDGLAKNHAKYFDKNGWLYFTKQTFDLLYPSYGDSYPMFLGSIGMTYEQAGGGKAGLGIINDNYQLLTLKERIEHHFTTSMSTIEFSLKNKSILNENFYKFFFDKKRKYKFYILEGNSDVLNSLKKLLSKHEISFNNISEKQNIKGYDYQKEKNTSKTINANSLLINTNQVKGKLAEILFEPKTKLNDSLTYDITAWSLPYAYGLKALASNEKVKFKPFDNEKAFTNSLSNNNYGFGFNWKSFEDSKFLASLLKEKILVRFNKKEFTNNKNKWDLGSIFILRGDNNHIKNTLTKTIDSLAKKYKRNLIEINSGYSEKGIDLGSRDIKMIKKLNVGILGGSEVSPYNYGEIWYFFEKQLKYPLTQIPENKLSEALKSLNTLILPSGSHKLFKSKEKTKLLTEWIKSGGKIIMIGRSLDMLTENKIFEIQKKSNEFKKEPLISYSKSRRNRVSNNITGSIYKVNLDSSHFLSYGLDLYYTLKLSGKSYNFLEKGYNAGYLSENAKASSGFVGSNVKNIQKNSLIFGEQKLGKGSVIYFIDNPLFRGFWYSGKILFSNALFFR